MVQAVVSYQIGPLAKMLIGFYANRLGRSQAGMIRKIVRRYVGADRSFNPEAFELFVKTRIVPLEPDAHARQQLLAVTGDYVQTWIAASAARRGRDIVPQAEHAEPGGCEQQGIKPASTARTASLPASQGSCRMTVSEILSFRLGVLEKAFVEFYADTYAKSQAEIVRTMISKYVNADKAFKPEAFNRFVKNKLVPVIEDEEVKKELVRVTRDYVGTRKGAEGTTLTTSKGK